MALSDIIDIDRAKGNAVTGCFVAIFWLLALSVTLGGLFFGAILTLFGSSLGPMLLVLGAGAFLVAFFAFFLVKI